MKIAFVGKGGSGKSTICSLFIKYLEKKEQVGIAVDADMNIHLPILLGCSIDPKHALSLPENSLKVKEYLKGTNARIKDASSIVKSTPPGRGSCFLTCNADHPILSSFASSLGHFGFLLHVGTYEKDGIGESCYHTNLAIFESLLSHTFLKKNEWLVADMVAGTDAFAGTLHAQFDAIVLIVEPTPEGVSVFKQYMELAKAAKVDDYIYALGNKIDDDEDMVYLQSNIGSKLVGFFRRQLYLKRSRQSGETIDIEKIEGVENVFDRLIEITRRNIETEDHRISLLHDLHLKHAQADYVIARYGDLSEQIDPDFSLRDVQL